MGIDYCAASLTLQAFDQWGHMNKWDHNTHVNIYNQQSGNLPAAGIPSQKHSVGLSSIQEVFHKVTDHVLDKSYRKQY